MKSIAIVVACSVMTLVVSSPVYLDQEIALCGEPLVTFVNDIFKRHCPEIKVQWYIIFVPYVTTTNPPTTNTPLKIDDYDIRPSDTVKGRQHSLIRDCCLRKCSSSHIIKNYCMHQRIESTKPPKKYIIQPTTVTPLAMDPIRPVLYKIAPYVNQAFWRPDKELKMSLLSRFFKNPFRMTLNI